MRRKLRRDPSETANSDPAPKTSGLTVAREKKRNRSWEKAQRTGDLVQVSYRKIPTFLRDKIKAIAEEKLVTADEVARAFLERGLEAYEAGDFELTPTLKTGRYTLFSENRDD